VSWDSFSNVLHKIAGSHYSTSVMDDEEVLAFLERIGLTVKEISPRTTDYSAGKADSRWWVRALATIADSADERARVHWMLTPTGKALYTALFVTANYEAAQEIAWSVADNDPVISRVVRVFAGQQKVRLQQLKDFLRLDAVADASETSLHTLLQLLEGLGIVELDQRWWTFGIRQPPPRLLPESSTNKAYLLGPTTPFSNHQHIKDLLTGLSGSVYWMDKHFRKEALAWIVESMDGTRTPNITIISGPDNIDRSAQDDFKKAQKELSYRGATLDWKVIPKTHAHRLHDRWIWDDAQSFNVPPVASMMAHQIAEINPTTNRPQVQEFLEHARPVLEYPLT